MQPSILPRQCVPGWTIRIVYLYVLTKVLRGCCRGRVGASLAVSSLGTSNSSRGCCGQLTLQAACNEILPSRDLSNTFLVSVFLAVSSNGDLIWRLRWFYFILFVFAKILKKEHDSAVSNTVVLDIPNTYSSISTLAIFNLQAFLHKKYIFLEHICPIWPVYSS
jgi:hypothetical protein